MSARYTPIRLYREYYGERILSVRDSLNITFYMQHPHHELRHQVERALAAYLQVVGLAALGWYVDSEGDWQELDESGWGVVRQALHQRGGTRLILREKPDDNTGYELRYTGKGDSTRPEEVSALSFWLPTEYLEEHGPEKVRALALALGAELPFNSGHAGLSFHFNEAALGVTRSIRERCFQFPGLEISNLTVNQRALGTRLSGVYWLTFLEQPVLGAVGGAGGLRSRLQSSDIQVEEMAQERAVVTLGTWPEAGDTEPDRHLAPYRDLARVLEPWLYLGRPPLSGFTEDDMRRWERRFLETAP